MIILFFLYNKTETFIIKTVKPKSEKNSLKNHLIWNNKQEFNIKTFK